MAIKLTKNEDDFNTTLEYVAFIEGDTCGYKRASNDMLPIYILIWIWGIVVGVIAAGAI